jgi:hypothetical protein
MEVVTGAAVIHTRVTSPHPIQRIRHQLIPSTMSTAMAEGAIGAEVLIMNTTGMYFSLFSIY